MPEQLTRQEVKEVLEEGLKEWMDEKFTQLGKWSAASIGAAAFGLLGYLLVVIGSHK